MYKGAYNSVTLSNRLGAIQQTATRLSGLAPNWRDNTATAIIDRPLQRLLQATKRQWRP
ncbi:hypothetical protein HME01_05860 [Vreelandella aquamarina]|uniref:Uncharacterized protein n=1 Tax=Vreelandella aquamarina TaxID=77097 RepID=A0A6F8SQB9_9GAMM|nr:hypothetical protein HMSLTHF_01530 [Halomonas meridiana]BCB72262.1 hypothetical protein HMEPL2_26130 [Halomonas meridiana]GED44734.1 hypothetical protein HME01_05860 [Halomonas meridiana]